MTATPNGECPHCGSLDPCNCYWRYRCCECDCRLTTQEDRERGAHAPCINAWAERYTGPDASNGEYFEGSGSSNFGNHNGRSDAAW